MPITEQQTRIALSAALIRLRAEMKITQQELGRRANYSRQEISLLECRKRTPSFHTIFQLCNALQIDEVVMFMIMRHYLPKEMVNSEFSFKNYQALWAAEASGEYLPQESIVPTPQKQQERRKSRKNLSMV